MGGVSVADVFAKSGWDGCSGTGRIDSQGTQHTHTHTLAGIAGSIETLLASAVDPSSATSSPKPVVEQAREFGATRKTHLLQFTREDCGVSALSETHTKNQKIKNQKTGFVLTDRMRTREVTVADVAVQ
jgi:hypothetical protein